jgi:16S rRNA (guanine527-N7)-methyltransferase
MGMEKSTEFSNEMSLLAEKAAALGTHLSSLEIDLFKLYLKELWEWNQRFNLTGLKTLDRIVIELFLDSLIPSPCLPDEGLMLDAGSGAGFPGVPLKILHPRIEIRLLESNAKKVIFLRHIVRSLQLKGAQVIQGRIEASGKWFHAEAFQVITARALADLRQIISWCSPLLKDGGYLVAFLGAEGERTGGRESAGASQSGAQGGKALSIFAAWKENKKTYLHAEKARGGNLLGVAQRIVFISQLPFFLVNGKGLPTGLPLYVHSFLIIIQRP